MTLRAFGILLAITTALVMAAIAVIIPRLSSPGQVSGEVLFADLATRAENVASLTILAGGKTLTLKRTAEGWNLAERGGYPAESEKIWQAFFGLASLRLVEAKTTDPARYPQLHLSDPNDTDSQAREIRVQDQNGTDLAALIVGRRKQNITVLGEGGVYVRRPGAAQSWLASGALAIGHDAAFWVDPLILSIPVTRIHRLSIRQDDGALLEIIRNTPEDRRFEIIGLDPSQESNPRALERLGAAFDGLLLDDVRPLADVTDGGDGGNGAGDQPLVARLETFDGLEITARSVYWAPDDDQNNQSQDNQGQNNQEKSIWATFSAKAPAGQPLAVEEAATLQQRLDGWIFRLKPFQADNLRMTKAAASQPVGTQADSIIEMETLGLDPQRLN